MAEFTAKETPALVVDVVDASTDESAAAAVTLTTFEGTNAKLALLVELVKHPSEPVTKATELLLLLDELLLLIAVLPAVWFDTLFADEIDGGTTTADVLVLLFELELIELVFVLLVTAAAAAAPATTAFGPPAAIKALSCSILIRDLSKSIS